MMPARDPAPSFPSLVCPVDRLSLEPRGGALACAQGHRFDVRLGIPRLVPADSGYTAAFGEQWNRYRVTQLDSYTGTTISRDRLRRCLGEPLWADLQGSGEISVLETGCGAGRFSEILLEAPATVLTSTDLSSAVEANLANCPASDRHRVIQCDIDALPFRPASYDIVLCLGVIQHTADPEAAIAALYAQVRPGGWLVIDHYAPSLARYTKFSGMALRPILKRLPPRMGTAATEALSKVLFPVHRLVKRHRRLQQMLSRVSPLLTYYHVYPELDDRLQYEWAMLDTHDSLTDYYKHLRSAPRIRATLSQLGASDIWVAKGGNGVEARCRRPPGRA